MKNTIAKILLLMLFLLLMTSCQSILPIKTPQDTLIPTQTYTNAPCYEHSFSLWRKTMDETCLSAGEEIRDCIECGFIQTREISKSEFHSYVSTGECKVCGDKMDEGFRFVLASDGKSYAFTYSGSAESVLVPAAYNDKPVTEIGNAAFWLNSNVKKVKLSDNITKIGDRAFQFCTNLKSINTPKSLSEIGKEAFSNCQLLSSFKFPEGFKQIEESTFEGCHSLSLSLPDTIVYIGSRAFYECTSIKNLKIPASVSSIGEAAFSSCRNLTTIEIEEGTKLKVIPKSAFSSGESLKKVILPEGIVCIEKEAFSGHPHFEEIYLPSTLETIGDKAFYVVDSFKVHYNGSESDWNKIEFGEKWIDALTVPTFDFTK